MAEAQGWDDFFRVSADEQGQLFRRVMGPSGQPEYAPYWFILQKFLLFYFLDPESDVPDGVINLQGAILARKERASVADRFALNLTATRSFEYKSQVASRQRTFFLEAESSATRESWLEKLRAAAAVGEPLAPDKIATARDSSRQSSEFNDSAFYASMDIPSPDATAVFDADGGSGIYGHPAHSGIYGHPAQSGNGIVASGGGSTLPGKSAGATPLEEPRYEAPSASPVSPTTPGASPAAPSVTFLNVQAASPDYISDEPAVSACLVRNTAAPPSVGERAAAGVDALLMELRKVDSIFTKDDGATALVTHVTKTAKVGQTLMPLIPPVTAEVVASDTTYAAHIQTRTQRLAAVLPEFVKAGIALKELLCDKEALEAEGGTFLHHECYVRLCEQAFALSHCFRDIWQGLGMYRLLKVAKTKTTGHEAVHTILRRLDGHLAELVGSVNANDTKAYIEMTRPIMVFGAQLMKAVAAASEEIGVGVVGEAIGFYQEPRVMAARERLANSITELLSATKASVGVWPGPHASQDVLLCAYAVITETIHFLGLVQTMPILWGKMSFSSLVAGDQNEYETPKKEQEEHRKQASMDQLVSSIQINTTIASTAGMYHSEIAASCSRAGAAVEDCTAAAITAMLTSGRQLAQEVEALELGTVPEEIVTNWSTTLARFAETLQALAAFGEEDAPGREEAVTLLPRVQADSESLIRGIIALLKTQKLRMRALSKELHSEEAVLSRSKTQRLRVNELERLRKESGKAEGEQTASSSASESTSSLDSLTVAAEPAVTLPEEEDDPSQIVFHQAGGGDGDAELAGAGSGSQATPAHAGSAFKLKCDVRGGTLAKLVERMTFHRQPETSLARAFLLTYRSFTTPMTLLEMLVQRFNVQPPPGYTDAQIAAFKSTRALPIRLRVFNSLKMWINMSPHEFTCDEVLVQRLERFIRDTMEPALPTAANSVRKMLDATLDRQAAEARRSSSGVIGSASAAARSARFVQDMPETKLPPGPLPPPEGIDLLQLDPMEVARQMTLVDWEYFKAIQPRECLDQCWTKPETGPTQAPNLLAMIERANEISHWVTMSVLRGDDKKERANALIFFIKLIERFRTINNFHGAMAVHAGLSNSAVHRLKHTWAKMKDKNPEKAALYVQQQEVLSGNQNFSVYRQVLHTSNPPCLPFLGVYLTDLVMIDGGNTNIIPGTELINFDKRRKIACVIEEIQRYQQLGYAFRPVPAIQTYLQDHFEYEEDADKQYARSLELEPRGADSPVQPRKVSAHALMTRARSVRKMAGKRLQGKRRPSQMAGQMTPLPH